MQNLKTASALAATQIIAKLVHLNGWRLFGDGPELAIEKEFNFDTHSAAAAFVGSVALLAAQHAHFPDIVFTQARCVVRWRTASVQGISQLDFDGAARIDAFSALL
ncbi:4a-hydroxytetrahydrobiopterin dehydratase [Rhodoferax aquaticus]|uniref:4a-hydroxytetrahydrobiopterin dehydratase n=1 Tax=Rhodoferax aquaticus TaxID=2527691 RepID=A0A515ERU5_9BURK|nr:4a-hydroxytetrahydrobiopterin dehydratase [Rhodoferax aquaticus]